MFALKFFDAEMIRSVANTSSLRNR